MVDLNGRGGRGDGMEIKNIRTIFASVERVPGKRVEGMNVNVRLENARLNDGGLELEFDYVVSYLPDVGKLNMKGQLVISGQKEEIKRLSKLWEQKKDFDTYTDNMIMNGINYFCGTSGTLITRAIDFVPPIIPLPIVIPPKEEEKKV